MGRFGAKRRVLWLGAAAALWTAGCGAPPHASAPPPKSAHKTVNLPSAASSAPKPQQAAPKPQQAAPKPQKKAPAPKAWTSAPLDGNVYAQPVAVDGRIYTATENNTVYALDAATGRPLWHTHLGAPVARSALPCGDISPTGITSTPVLDKRSGTLYVVTFSTQAGRLLHQLVALDAANGRVLWRRAADPPGSDPRVQQQRAALLLAGGRVYVPYGGLYGDCGPYHGWIVSFQAQNGSRDAVFKVPTVRGGAIWAPGGLAVGKDGALFAATGNSASQSQVNLGDSVVRLSAGLQLQDWFAPSNWRLLNLRDLDLGSLSPLPLGPDLLLQAGKEGIGYLLDPRHLGHVGGQLYSGRICAGAYGRALQSGQVVYVPCRDGLVAVRITRSPKPSFHTIWRTVAFDAGSPALGPHDVWTVDTSDATLLGIDPQSGRIAVRRPLGQAMHFDAPTIAQGRLVVAAGRRIKSWPLAGGG